MYANMPNNKTTTWNVRSICNKASLVGDYITEKNIDLLAVTETWLKEDADQHVINECVPNGYSFQQSPRLNATGGGLALVYKSSIKLSSWKALRKFKSFESTEATLTYHNNTIKLIILSYYSLITHK